LGVFFKYYIGLGDYFGSFRANSSPRRPLISLALTIENDYVYWPSIDDTFLKKKKKKVKQRMRTFSKH